MGYRTVLRAHHVMSVYSNYAMYGRLTLKGIDNVSLESPILVTDSPDDICRRCLSYPARNFCAGPKMRKEDRKAARKLGIEIGEVYSATELKELFQSMSKKSNGKLRRKKH